MQGEGDIVTERMEGVVIDVAEVPRRAVATDDLVIDLREPVAAEATGEELDDGPVDGDVAAGPAPQQSPVDELHGKVAVVTGGASGVGREVALALAASGVRVCVLGRDLASLRETVELAGPDAAILFLQCDVGSLSEIEGVVDFIERFDRPVDILVHADGVQMRGGVESGSANDLDEQYLVNVRGPYLMSQKLLGQLRHGPGHVVFVNSAPARVGGFSGDGQVAVTSQAVRALAAALRSEVEHSGIRVTTVQPELAAVTEDAIVALGATDIAESVLHTIRVPQQVEITDVQLRPRLTGV